MLPRGREGVGTADVVVALALLVVLLALLYPALRARSARAGFDAAAADIEAARRGAETHFRAAGAWPGGAAPGQMPPALAASFAGDTSLVRIGYALQWTTWDVVDHVAAPAPRDIVTDAPPDSVGPRLVPVVRRVGGVLVHSRDEALLAELLRRYSSEGGFVRDTTWTLVLPMRANGGR